MKKQRVHTISIAGFDPSGGAGILADIKTTEQCNAYGMGVLSATTVQNDSEFKSVTWFTFSQIIEQIKCLEEHFSFKYIKIGLVKDLTLLEELVNELSNHYNIIWDPILKASAGFQFHPIIDLDLLNNICQKVYLVTPNIPEAVTMGNNDNAEQNAIALSKYCNVYLKGGHSENKLGEDILFTTEGKQVVFKNKGDKVFSKHGSGCVLSAAITANLANDHSLEMACDKAKQYVHNYLASSETLLGYHSTIST